jgi:hypothetical protein
MTATARNREARTEARTQFDRWPLTRVLVFLLANGFLGLAIDIRVEHVDVVHEHAIAWLPIIYSCVMSVACLIAFVFWNKRSRLVMLPLFLAAFLVGGMGFYLHNHGNLRKVVTSSVGAWTNANMDRSDGPPQTAPLAFVGLGMIGILTSLRRFNT